RAAIESRDLDALGRVAERSALTMHASALAARPAVVYFRGATLEALEVVRGLRVAGVPAYATIDAGPHVKGLCHRDHAEQIAAQLAAVAGVPSPIPCAPGRPARLVRS